MWARLREPTKVVEHPEVSNIQKPLFTTPGLKGKEGKECCQSPEKTGDKEERPPGRNCRVRKRKPCCIKALKHGGSKEEKISFSLSSLTLHSLASASRCLNLMKSQMTRETIDEAHRVWVELDI